MLPMRGMIVVVLAGLAATAAAEELKNDGFGAGASVSFQGGFRAGEMAAARFVPSDTAPRLLTGVQFLFGGAASTETITLHVWDDTGLGDAPGPELFTGDFDVTGQNDASQVLDLTAQSLLVTGPFRVGIEVHHDSFPGVAADTDGIAADRNFIFTGTWQKSSMFGLQGDWIIRAEVQPFASLPDAGVDAARDGAVRKDGSVDAGGKAGDGGGCGCSTAGRGHGASPALALFGLGLGLAWRRRVGKRAPQL